MDSAEELLNLGYEKLKATEKSLRDLTDGKKYWKMLLERIEKFPLECMILETREEFGKMWLKCLKTEDDLQHVKLTWSNDFSEALLQKHRADLDQLKSFYFKNRALIDMLNKYDKMWECLANLDKQSSDPERLFKNRGAQLLKEEHDRKLSNKIPQLEKEIFQLLEKRLKGGLEDFLVHGEKFSDLVKRRWEQHKENLRSRKRPMEQKAQSVGPEAKKKQLEIMQSQKVQSVGKGHISALQELRPVNHSKGAGCKVSRALQLV